MTEGVTPCQFLIPLIESHPLRLSATCIRVDDAETVSRYVDLRHVFAQETHTANPTAWERSGICWPRPQALMPGPLSQIQAVMSLTLTRCFSRGMISFSGSKVIQPVLLLFGVTNDEQPKPKRYL